MIQAVFLDTSPLGLMTKRAGHSLEVDACRNWVARLSNAGVTVYVPEIADYEVRRELLRAGQTQGIGRLDTVKAAAHYLPITTDTMLLAASFWATARRGGYATADPKAIDGDVILAAQTLTESQQAGLPVTDFIVATDNVGHLSRYVPADVWTNIQP